MSRLTLGFACTALTAAVLALSPAAARPSTMTSRPVAPSPTVRGPAYPGFGLNFGRQRLYTVDGPVRGRGPGWNGHNGHDGGNHHGSWRHRGTEGAWYGWGYGGDGDGYVDSETRPDQFGYFGSGGEISATHDKPVYHYDRGYPYEYYRGPARARTYEAEAVRGSPASVVHCDTQTVTAGAKGRRVAVRVCRGS